MRIGIDCRTILNPEKGESAGIGHYTYQLVRYLIKIDKDNDYVLFFDRSVQQRRLAKFKQNNVFIRFFPFIQYTRLMPAGYSHFLASAFIAREKLDIFHSPTLSLPTSYQGPSVVTAHDLGIYKMPELYPEKNAAALKKEIFQAIQQTTKIIAASRSTANDLKEIFGVPDEKIKVISHGLDERFFEKRSKAQIEVVKNKYGIKGEYLLFLGTLDPRKNILRIISAYERFRDKIVQVTKRDSSTNELTKATISDLSIPYQLVLAGDWGFKPREIKEKIAASKYKEDIIVSGYIEADDLDALLEGAKMFIFPSLYEGFGLPLTEAMANGVPVITSNISSMPEIAKGRAVLVDPLNVAEITQAIYDLLADPELYQDLQEAGREYSQKFNWEKTAQETLDVYKELIKIK